MNQRFAYCPKCGGMLEYRRMNGRQRLVCQICCNILYENPVVGVAAIIRDQDRILLGRRNPQSTYPGRWCIPCGYVEYDEDVYDAVKREIAEETHLTIAVTGIFTVLSNFHNPQTHTVGIWFNARVAGGVAAPGDDVDRIEFFSLNKMPELAFPTDREVIEMLRNGKNPHLTE